jgi:transcription initiation factor TFIIB
MCVKGKSIITDFEAGELICSDCGMVISDNIQENNRSERSAFNIMELNDRSRTGAPTTLARHDMGLATVIGNGDKDASGTKINVAMRSTMNRLRTWDFRTQHQASNDRNLEQAFTELDKLKDKLGLSDAAVQKTAYIYRKLQKRGYVRGRSILSVLAAAIYIACREIGISRTIKDIAAISNIRRKEIARIYRLLVFELDIKIPMVDPMKCIVKVANKANLNENIVRQAVNIMKDLNNREISAGKNPMVLAATVLYLSCFKSGQNITQDDISHAAGITGVTLRNRLNDLNNKFN